MLRLPLTDKGHPRVMRKECLFFTPPAPLMQRHPAACARSTPRRLRYPPLPHTHARPVFIEAEARFNGDPSGARKRRGRKTGTDIATAREKRSRHLQTRRPVVAVWSGVVLAESSEYEFLDGRFYFPPDSVCWEVLEETGRTRHQNPMGLSKLYDIVVRRGRSVSRNRSAVMRFTELKRPWAVMSGYSCFWKGVKVFSRREHKTVPDSVKDEGKGEGENEGEDEEEAREAGTEQTRTGLSEGSGLTAAVVGYSMAMPLDGAARKEEEQACALKGLELVPS